MNTQTYDWILLSKMPDGHYLFADNFSYGRMAIGDDSGDAPHLCDDGVLWLDTNKNLMLGDSCILPLLDEKGYETQTITDAATIVLLASQFEWLVNCRGILFEIKRADRR